MFMLAVKRKVTFHKISHRPQGEFNIGAWVTNPKASEFGLEAHPELTSLCSADVGGGEECTNSVSWGLCLINWNVTPHINPALSHVSLPYHTGRTAHEHLVADSPLCHWRTEQEETLENSQRSIHSDGLTHTGPILPESESKAIRRWPCYQEMCWLP